ncbi:MAG: purine-binding chemotaxis protein CheW [Lachnospiraceae bacterium]|nr:purine-binding chemotaxis protein CheW [Lachnospiraceae bacterium]
MANNMSVVGDGRKQFIVVKIGSEQYGIDISYVDNIVRMQKITRVPKAQPYFKGIINLRGEIVPVMSIRTKMDLEPDEFTDVTRIIILKLEEHGVLGILVDEVREVVTLAPEEIDKVAYDAKSSKSNFINGVGKHGEELISLFDTNSIIDETETV